LRLLHPTCSPPPGDRCAGCNGSCLVSEKKTFEVQVEQGMKHGQRIVLRGEAGCTEPGLTPGDVVLVVQQKPHDTFKRIQQANPSDLLLEKTISLKEALCGCSFTVQHLDGRTLHIKTNEGQVIKPNSFMVVQSEGMPVHGRPFVKGNLYVRFEVSWGQVA
jgi:DnaJ family protein A protein 2